MTNVQLSREIARATGDDHAVIMSRGFSLVDESIPIDNDDLDALIADWNRIRNEDALARVGGSLRSVTHLSKIRNRKNSNLAANVVG